MKLKNDARNKVLAHVYHNARLIRAALDGCNCLLFAIISGRGHTEISCIHYPRIVSPTTMETTQTDEVATGLYNDNEEKGTIGK